MSEPLYVGCNVLCHVLPNLTSDIVLAWIGYMPSTFWLTRMLTHYLWSVEVRLYTFWVPYMAVFMLISRFLHWNWCWKWCIMKRYRLGLVYYGHRPLSHWLVLLLGLRDLRGVVTLLSKFVFLEMYSKCGAYQSDQGVFARKTYKKHVFTCGTTWVG